MPVIIGEKKQAGENAPYYKRQIHCPGHYFIPPKVDVYLREPVDFLKNCSNEVELAGKRFKIRKTRIATDRFGNKRIDWKKLYDLRRKGIVLSPTVSAAWAIEHIYDPKGYLCMCCPKYCKEGQGRVVTSTIRRLVGLPMRR